MLRATLLASAFLASLASASAQQSRPVAPGAPAAQPRGTSEDERACKDDALALCPTVVGNDMAVLACFKANRAKLSRACTGVLQKYGQL